MDWQQYPEEVVDRKWRTEAARLHRVLDAMGVRPATGPRPGAGSPTLPACWTTCPARSGRPTPGPPEAPGPAGAGVSRGRPTVRHRSGGPPEPADHAAGHRADRCRREPTSPRTTPRGADLAARLSAELGREEAQAARRALRAGSPRVADSAAPAPSTSGATEPLPLFPLQPPRTGRELLADHVTAMVCCAAVDTAGAAPGLDWLDGPALLVDGERRADWRPGCSAWSRTATRPRCAPGSPTLGVRPEKPVRLV